jgi:hypothetical protein
MVVGILEHVYYTSLSSSHQQPPTTIISQGLARPLKKSRSRLLTSLTTTNFLSLEESQPDNYDIFESQKVSVLTTTKLPVLKMLISLVHYSLDNFQLSLSLEIQVLGLIIETMQMKVSVSF